MLPLSMTLAFALFGGVPVLQDGGETPASAEAVRAVLVRSQSATDAAQARERCVEALRIAAEVAPSPELWDVVWDVSDRAEELHDLSTARDASELVLVICEDLYAPDDPRIPMAKAKLAVLEHRTGDTASARRLLTEAVAAMERVLPPGHENILGMRNNLARVLQASGDLEAARVEFERLVIELEPRGEGDQMLQMARANLGATLFQLGELEQALAYLEQAVAGMERILPPSAFELTRTRSLLANTLARLGDADASLRFYERLLANMEASRSEDDPDLHIARLNTGGLRAKAGDREGARELLEQALAGLRQLYPDDHDDVQRARTALGAVLRELGELERSQELSERALSALRERFPPDHPDVLMTQSVLALVLRARGDLARARELQEGVLEQHALRLPPDHPAVLLAMSSLASTLSMTGDREGARALQESVLEAALARLGEDHPDVADARINLALTLKGLDHPDAARALEEKALATWLAIGGADHPRVAAARLNLAGSLMLVDELERAVELLVAAVESLEHQLPATHPDLQRARGDLAWAHIATGELERARPLQRDVLASFERSLPAWHPDRCRARVALAWTIAALDESADLSELSRGVRDDFTAAIERSALVSYREAAATLAYLEGTLATVLSLESRIGSAADTFELVESLRVASTTVAGGRDVPSASEAFERTRSLRRQVAVLSSTEDAGPALDEAIRLRDDAERELRELVVDAGRLPTRVVAAGLGTALEEGTAAVGFRVYGRREVGTSPMGSGGAPWLLAHVVAADGTASRVELGSLVAVAELVARWRSSIGAPVDARGMGTADEREEKVEREAGQSLRELVLDPVFAAAKGARTLHVCGDSVLHVLPLDALPLGGESQSPESETIVADRYRLVNEVSFERLLAPLSPPESEPVLVVFGGVEFEEAIVPGPAASEREDEPRLELLVAATPPWTPRARDGIAFAALPGTRVEVREIADLFRTQIGGELELRQGGTASRHALHALAPRARFLHLATHGYFADERAASFAEGSAESGWKSSRHEVLAGMAPMTLCGLALAGANAGPDELGRVRGIVTAEELAGLDLAACDLAVLSACETNVGVQRAGQGVASLQRALHAAGARTVVTSLWRVSDEATSELMVELYRRLWEQGESKWDALDGAKKALRDEGHPTANWAGWVLTGAPF